MKYNAITDYPHTADLYTVTSIDPDNGTYFFAFDRQIKIKFVSRDRKPLMITDEVIDIQSQIQNIVDENGVELQPNNAWRVVSDLPVQNPFGFVEERSYLLGWAQEA